MFRCSAFVFFQRADLKNLSSVGFLLLGLLILWGNWLNGADAWGFNHFSYFPWYYSIIWLVLISISLTPAVQCPLTRSLHKSIPDFLFRKKAGSVFTVVFFGLLFFALKSRSVFLGDGYLITNLMEKGTTFRVFDNMDFFFHRLIYQKVNGYFSAADVYSFGSIFGGACAVALLILLIKRLPWEPWRKVFLLALFLFSGPVVFFFGYVESYTFLFIFITSFLISGVLYLEDKSSAFLPSFFFGMALFFHLSALFSLPALVFLYFQKSPEKKVRHLFQIFAPALILLIASVTFHIVDGFSTQWFRHEFLDNQNTQNIWMPLTGQYGVFSLANLKDQLNLALLLAPVSLLIILGNLKKVFIRRNEPVIPFLLFHLLWMGLFSLFIDRKLGMARDWDLLAAHSSSLFLLASVIVTSNRTHPSKVIAQAVVVSFFLTLPWVVLQQSETRSIKRVAEAAMAFPPSAKAHTFEEMGQFFREKGNLEKSEAMYDLCISADEHHYRYFALRGATRFSLAQQSAPGSPDRKQYASAALQDFQNALERNSEDLSSRKNIGKLLLMKGETQKARKHLLVLVEKAPNDSEGWEILGFCHFRLKEFHRAAASMERASSLAVLPQSSKLKSMLVICYLSIIEQNISAGQKIDPVRLSKCGDLVEGLLDESPGNARYLKMGSRLQKIEDYLRISGSSR